MYIIQFLSSSDFWERCPAHFGNSPLFSISLCAISLTFAFSLSHFLWRTHTHTQNALTLTHTDTTERIYRICKIGPRSCEYREVEWNQTDQTGHATLSKDACV